MENESTPGPWEIVPETTGKGEWSYFIRAPHDQDGGTTIAAIMCGNDSEANAHLIATAQELRAELEACADYLGEMDHGPIEQARAVIAKSYGKTVASEEG